MRTYDLNDPGPPPYPRESKRANERRADKKRIAELEAQVTRLQRLHALSESRHAHDPFRRDDRQKQEVSEYWALRDECIKSGDFDPVKGESDTRTLAERIADTTIDERRKGRA